MYEFSDMLFDFIENSAPCKFKARPEIERVPPLELRSDMLEKAGTESLSLLRMKGTILRTLW